MDVWLGSEGEVSVLEADVRAVCSDELRELPALAMALGDVARLHKLEVRVIPRGSGAGRTILVLFGRRVQRTGGLR